ncbi:hypothetical protein [Parabacteroides sp. AF48-14]|uniref:hypothetical protein n=1 Tax=Parabacteroides sp. AF48-14 TaxID=2292052 RepID=UPI001F2C868A|nr:hypothetical protein [Parabacteroides sp. AF48-14]
MLTNTFVPEAPLMDIWSSDSHTPGACDSSSVPSFPLVGEMLTIKRSALRSISLACTTTSFRRKPPVAG